MRAVQALVAVLLVAGCASSTPITDTVVGARLSPDGRTLTVTVAHGTCEEGERRAMVTETPADVRVRVSGARALSGECVDQGVVEELEAQLETPLGDRDVVDASTGDVVAVRDRSPAPSTPVVNPGDCPRRFDGLPAPPSGDVPTGTLAPDGEPVAALLCSYVGDNTTTQRGLTLSASVQLELPLTDVLTALRDAVPVPEQQLCTLIGGSQVNHLLRLEFPASTVWISAADEPNSCVPTDNGVVMLMSRVAPLLTDLAGLS
jgi:hypothetical protein